MDRRTLMTSIAGAAAVACSARDEVEAKRTGRPTLAVESEGPGRWRIRSWQWEENAWRPAIARAQQTAAGIEFSGPIAAADRAKVVARLDA
ncbi:hypothetical protein [Sphingopyxis sp. R3-92]|uniref:hypothetical protein n=1 Tax=Sphingopyxis sp. R3-92 TaxID=3158553 RepID=UPI003EE5C4F3